MSKKIIIFVLFVGMMNISCFAAETVQNTDVIKESNSKFKELKKLFTCFKDKAGCSRKQIAAMFGAAAGIVVLITGGTFLGYTMMQKIPYTPEKLKEILNKKYGIARYTNYLANYKDEAGDNAFRAALKLEGMVALPATEWEALQRLAESEESKK